MKPAGMRSTHQHPQEGAGILVWGLVMGLFAMLIGVLMWLGGLFHKHHGKVYVTCALTCPSVYTQEGWHCYAPEDRDYINLQAGHIEFKSIDNLVSCTRYENNKTPTEFKAAMQMWRKI